MILLGKIRFAFGKSLIKLKKKHLEVCKERRKYANNKSIGKEQEKRQEEKK